MNDFWKKVFASGGEQSWGRVAASVALAFSCFWITWLVLKFTAPADYEKLYALGAFVLSLGTFVGSLYWISKRYETMQADKKENAPEPPKAG